MLGHLGAQPELVSAATGATCTECGLVRGGREQGGAGLELEAGPWGRSTGSRAAMASGLLGSSGPGVP